MDNINLVKEHGMSVNEIIPIDTKKKEFSLLMDIYQKASDQVFDYLIKLKDNLKEIYGYDVINNIIG